MPQPAREGAYRPYSDHIAGPSCSFSVGQAILVLRHLCVNLSEVIDLDSSRTKRVKNSVGRALFVAVSVLLQAVWIVGLVLLLNDYYYVVSLVTSLLAFLVVLNLYGQQMTGPMKASWIILILFFPVMGVCIYLMFGHSNCVRGMRKRFDRLLQRTEGLLGDGEEVLARVEKEDRQIANQLHYLSRRAGFPAYDNTDVVYYATAEEGLEAQKEALRQAEHFIFMEYHAIEDSQSFRGLEEILVEKARQGVEVRLLYDDMGSMGFISPAFIKRMQALGIQCRVFNPLLPVLNIFMNNRDHRKITVIDGKVGFTGGYNLADEYFNLTHPFGWWKDTGVKLTGDAVPSLTVMFLTMWNGIKETDDAFAPYLPEVPYQAKEGGIVVPYADSPLDDEQVGENVYLNMVKQAKDYVYIMTPYLILDDELISELTLAAMRGVEVRIITPGIPDKKLVYRVTRSYYSCLVNRGVRVFEYTPGFCHAKMMLCDGETAAVGTINLDYRSLYLHFENGVFLSRCSALGDIRKDFLQTFEQCREVTEDYKGKRLTFWQTLLRLFAPLM